MRVRGGPSDAASANGVLLIGAAVAATGPIVYALVERRGRRER
jgi:hypothetical protein